MLRSSLARGIAQQRAMLRRSMSTSTAARPLRRVVAFIGGGGLALGGGYYMMQPKPVLKEEGAEEVDALIIGGGIMGTTLFATLLSTGTAIVAATLYRRFVPANEGPLPAPNPGTTTDDVPITANFPAWVSGLMLLGIVGDVPVLLVYGSTCRTG